MKNIPDCPPAGQLTTDVPVDARRVPVVESMFSMDEQVLVDSFRQMPSVPQLAVRCYVLRRDIRLARVVYDRVFLNLPVRQFPD